MAAKLSQPQRFEVPPFELVKLVHPPAFSAVASSLSPNYAAAGHAFGGPSSPPASSTQPINLGNVGSPPPLSSLSGRLSQLVNPRLADQRRSSWASSDSGHVAGPAIATPPPAGHDAGTPSSSKQVIRTAEAGNDTIYLAGSEGGLAVWKLDPSRTASDKGKQKAVGIQGEDVVSDNAEEAAYLLDQYNIVPGKRPIEKLAVLATVGKAIVLSEGLLTFHSLPSFAPLPTLAPIRGVSTFAVDLSNPHGTHVSVCIIKRRSMQLYSISQFSIEQGRDLPLRSTAILAVLRRSALCIADAMNYSLVDLEAATMTPLLPISQDPPEQSGNGVPPDESSSDFARPKSYQRPSIVTVAADEFLVASHTGHSTLGLFIKENGEPTRGTLEWASNPKSIVVQGEFVIALLQDNSLEIHNIVSQELVQVIQLATLFTPRSMSSPISSVTSTPNAHSQALPITSPQNGGKVDMFQPRVLVSCSAGFPDRKFNAGSATAFSPLLVPHSSSSLHLDMTQISLFPKSAEAASIPALDDTTPSAKMSPPVTPRRERQVPQTSGVAATRPSVSRRVTTHISTVPASTLIIGRDAVLGLCPLTLVAQADALIDNNRVEDALRLLQSLGQLNSREKIEEARYIRQKAAWTYLSSTRFTDAGPLFFQSRADPRLLIRLFPEIYGNMYSELHIHECSVYAGLERMLVDMVGENVTVDDIIRNYAPHLEPASPPMQGLSHRLMLNARSMLRDFLIPWRIERRAEGLDNLGFDAKNEVLARDIDRLVDTCLAKLYLEDRQYHPALITMLEQEAHDCDVEQLRPLLEQNQMHWYLSQLYLAKGQVSETLSIWAELVDQKRHDSHFTDGLAKIYNLLDSLTDIRLVQMYALWLVDKDRSLALKLLTKPGQIALLKVDEIMEDLRSKDDDAAFEFLQSAVFQRRGTDAKYHGELIHQYFTKLEHQLQEHRNQHNLLHFRQLYIASADTVEMSFVRFLQADSIDDDLRKLRAKLIILLHASNFYDYEKARQRLQNMQGTEFELAIVLAKLDLHEATLEILATLLRDSVAAEAYCTHANTQEILGPKNVREILSLAGLPLPAALLRKDGRRRQAIAGSTNSLATTPEQRETQRQELLNLLIKITLKQSCTAPADTLASEQARASHIIDTQAIRIPPRDILPSIPDEWPLHLMESFMTRSLRRTLHARYEQKLVKALLQGQTLDVSVQWFDMVEALGGTLAEEASADGSDGWSEPGDAEKGGNGPEEVVYLDKDVNPDDEKAVDLL